MAADRAVVQGVVVMGRQPAFARVSCVVAVWDVQEPEKATALLRRVADVVDAIRLTVPHTSRVTYTLEVDEPRSGSDAYSDILR
jgi:hypothetical protein